MTHYRIKRLDRRFKLKRDHDFEIMLEWKTDLHNLYSNESYRESRRYERACSQVLGEQFFESWGPARNNRWVRRTVTESSTSKEYSYRTQLFLRKQQDLTLLLLSV